MIYTSYWGRTKALQKFGIEPVAISRGKPERWNGRSIDALAPTWQMLRMSDEDYDRCYAEILAGLDPHDIVRWLGDGDVALLCWESDIADCHRTTVANWLRGAGYEVEEFDPKKVAEERANCGTLSLF